MTPKDGAPPCSPPIGGGEQGAGNATAPREQRGADGSRGAESPPEPGTLNLTVIRAVIRQPPAAKGARWDNVVVGWLPDPGRLFCDQHPTARRCEHIDLVREAIR